MTEPTYYTESTDSITFYYDDDNPVGNWCNMEDIVSLSATFSSVLYSLIFLLSLLGNSLVLWIIMKYENLMSLTNLFIMNLCISDLAFSCTLPFGIVSNFYGWIFGPFLCKAVNAIFSISFYGSVILLTIMTILRYLAVVDPLSTLRTQTRRCGVLVSLAIWTSSMLVVVPEVIFTDIIPKDGKQHCEYINDTWKLVEMSQQIVFFLVSFITIAICYIKILKILLRSRSQRRHRTVKLIFTIVLVFFLCWGPFNVLCFLHVLSSWNIIKLSCQSRRLVFFAFDISRKVAFCHCCLNPVLYVFVGVKFRRHLKLLYKQCSPFPSKTEPSSPRIHSFHMGPYEDASMY